MTDRSLRLIQDRSRRVCPDVTAGKNRPHQKAANVRTQIAAAARNQHFHLWISKTDALIANAGFRQIRVWPSGFWREDLVSSAIQPGRLLSTCRRLQRLFLHLD